MDGRMFDSLTHAAAISRSRRHALRLLGGALVGGLVAAARPGSAQAYPSTCRRFVLSGGPSADDPISVDDDLTVRLNGERIFRDDDGGASQIGPIPFRARAGDHLQIIAVDVNAPCRELGQVYLHCSTGGKARKLSDGVSFRCNDKPPGVFFNKRYVI